MSKPKTNPTLSILFVCLGNLCRSTTAQAVFEARAAALNLPIKVDSAGTSGYHRGDPPDPRSREAGEARGYSFKGQRSRPVLPEDFERFDLILAMDSRNLRDLHAICPEDLKHKVELFLTYAGHPEQEVPDPYYGGRGGFELVLDMIEDASDALLDKLRQRYL
ncbi:low molecular weight phosphotyrosine protein phosphatase [Aliiglaciecola sp. CAU 1673]|uniref:low molecular weight protein-tyrosine-phosphatase n=1 Tax=Aliiglaciecola sp. CAU 1673 TaxID=3032595 RepID=UPI0023DC8B35|nr:low molecular weight protein-tyrosine-phosphatase [Aliiglaciecola sp. CAU 1673]MDF2179913.1 low molecular weight phosphotyrosine protein phosphatase [Aliiglaciecola sp. CAU 1673]